MHRIAAPSGLVPGARVPHHPAISFPAEPARGVAPPENRRRRVVHRPRHPIAPPPRRSAHATSPTRPPSGSGPGSSSGSMPPIIPSPPRPWGTTRAIMAASSPAATAARSSIMPPHGIRPPAAIRRAARQLTGARLAVSSPEVARVGPGRCSRCAYSQPDKFEAAPEVAAMVTAQSAVYSTMVPSSMVVQGAVR